MRQICSWRLGPCITCPFSKCSQRCQEMWGFPRGLFTEVALLEKETERAWGKALAAEGRYPADVAFVCRCSIWSVRWQLIFFSLSVNMSWQPHALSRVFRAVWVPAGPQPPGIFLSGRGGRVTFWPWLFPALSPFPNWCHSSELKLKLQNTQMLQWPLVKVARYGKHSCVSVNIIYWHFTSPNLIQASKCLLCLCANINLLLVVIEAEIWQCF